MLGHLVIKEGILMDLANISIIVEFSPPTSVRQLRNKLVYTGYYHKFIRRYDGITALMEKILKKDVKFQWTTECQEILDKLKTAMATAPILVFPN